MSWRDSAYTHVLLKEARKFVLTEEIIACTYTNAHVLLEVWRPFTDSLRSQISNI